MIVSVAIPLSVRDHAHRALRDRADPQRVHPRRSHLGDGSPRRRRRRRARVDPSTPTHGHEHGSSGPRRHQRRRAPRARLDAHDDGGAPAGAAPRWPGEEAFCPARSHRGGGDDRVLLRERVRHARRVSLFSRSFRAGPHRAAGARRRRRRRRSLCARPPRRVAVPRHHRDRVRPPHGRRGVGLDTPPEHVLPRDRRGDGTHLRAPRPRYFTRGVVEAHRRNGKDVESGAAERRRLAGAHQRRFAGERALRDDQPQQRSSHGIHSPRARRCRRPQALAARDRRPGPRALEPTLSRRGVPPVAGRSRGERVLERLHRARRGGAPGRQRRRAHGESARRRRGRAHRTRLA